jgi:glucarate dehydratase
MTAERAFKGTNDSSTHHLEPPSGDIIKNEFRTIEGALKVPEGPDLGIEIDEEKLERYHELYESGRYGHEPGSGRKDPYLWF